MVDPDNKAEKRLKKVKMTTDIQAIQDKAME